MLTHLKAGYYITGGQRETLTSRVASCRFPCKLVSAHSKPHNTSFWITKDDSQLGKATICGSWNVSIGKIHVCCAKCPCVRLESVASANVLQLLRDFGWCSVQLLCHTFLLVRVHAVKLLAQISINHILEKMTEFVFVILKYFLINRFRSWNYIIKIRRMCKNNPNLDWEVVGSKAEMVSATKRRKLWAHMHL